MKSGKILLPNNETICYEETGGQFIGQKPSLLFVHGNMSNSKWWHDTIQGLNYLKRHLIAVDLRGFGDSSYNTSCNRFGQWANDLKQFCKLRGISKCAVNGWSFGGGVTMKFAQIAPQIVEKIILTCSVSHQGLRFLTDNKPCITRAQIVKNHKAKFMVQLINSKSVQKMSQIFEVLLFTQSKDYPNEKKLKLINASFQQRCYLELLQALANSDIDISKIKAECLMIHGKLDMVIVLDSVQSTGKHFKNLIVLENNAHMIPIENPKHYQNLIAKFIEQK